MRQQVLLASAVPETMRVVVTALANDDGFASNGCCHSLAELPVHLQRRHYPVALVDIDPLPEKTLADLAPIISRFSETWFVILSGEMRGEWVLTAMRAGARNFLLKSSLGTELPKMLRELSRTKPAEEAGGALVTVLSAGGGCGATTLAVNLANSLHAITSQMTLLLDLDVVHGSVASYLELEGQYGLADILSHRGSIDPSLLLSTAVRYSEGLSVLISPASADFSSPAPLVYEQLPEALDACKRASSFAVVDAPRVSMDVAAVLAAQSIVTLIVLQMSVKDVRTARAMLAALTDRGVPLDKLRPVVNRYRKRNRMVSLDDAQKAMGSVRLLQVRNDYRSASRSLNYGKPLAQVASRSKLHRDIHQLARSIALSQSQGLAQRKGSQR